MKKNQRKLGWGAAEKQGQHGSNQGGEITCGKRQTKFHGLVKDLNPDERANFLHVMEVITIDFHVVFE